MADSGSPYVRPLSLSDLARYLELEVTGDGSVIVSALTSMEQAGPGNLSFCVSSTSLAKLRSTQAAAMLVPAQLVDQAPCPVLVSPDPRADFARLTALYDHRPEQPQGVHPGAVVSPDAQVDASARIGATAVVEAGARIGADVHIGAGSFVGAGTEIAEGSRLYPRVTLYDGVKLGRNSRVHSGTVIGADGFGFAPTSQGYVKFHQLGGVEIGDDFECGAMCTIDRGALDNTRIGRGVKLDDHVHIGHNVQVGEHTAIAGCVGIGGGVRIGNWCAIGGGVIILGHLEIADKVFVEATSMVGHSVREVGARLSSSWPGRNARQWRRWQRQILKEQGDNRT